MSLQDAEACWDALVAAVEGGATIVIARDGIAVARLVGSSAAQALAPVDAQPTNGSTP